MKKFVFVLAFISSIFLAACSNGTSSDNSSDGSDSDKAVNYVKKHLERGEKLVGYEIVTGTLPVAVEPDAFKSIRDAVNKANLDYQTCKVRGLETGMQKALQTLETCQEEIKSKLKNMDKDESQYEIVLATIHKNGMPEDHNTGLIVAFNPETQKMEKWIIVTTPIQNTAVLLAYAENGDLSQFGITGSPDTNGLANKVSDPVMKFILTTTAK